MLKLPLNPFPEGLLSRLERMPKGAALTEDQLTWVLEHVDNDLLESLPSDQTKIDTIGTNQTRNQARQRHTLRTLYHQ